MPREQFHGALDALRDDVLELGDLVVDRFADALTASAKGDDALARSVVEGDTAINRRYLELERDCIDLFALHAPMAGDLRLVAASFKILTDLERVGDLAVNLGSYTLATEADPLVDIDSYGIGADVDTQLRDALGAYGAADADACHAVADRDDHIDALCTRASEAVVRSAITRSSEDSWAAERALDEVSRCLLTIRDLERAGDHAVNIAARTLYMVEGDPELIY